MSSRLGPAAIVDRLSDRGLVGVGRLVVLNVGATRAGRCYSTVEHAVLGLHRDCGAPAGQRSRNAFIHGPQRGPSGQQSRVGAVSRRECLLQGVGLRLRHRRTGNTGRAKAENRRKQPTTHPQHPPARPSNLPHRPPTRQHSRSSPGPEALSRSGASKRQTMAPATARATAAYCSRISHEPEAAAPPQRRPARPKSPAHPRSRLELEP